MQVGAQTFHMIHADPASFSFVKWNKFRLVGCVSAQDLSRKDCYNEVMQSGGQWVISGFAHGPYPAQGGFSDETVK